jgi:hypothetical protein
LADLILEARVADRVARPAPLEPLLLVPEHKRGDLLLGKRTRRFELQVLMAV